MEIEVEPMKHLKIENGKGQYSVDGTTWKDLDMITKDELLRTMEFALNEEFEYDEYDKGKLPNPAQEIIYRNILTKIKELITKKERFKDESQQYYKDAISKYRTQKETN
jgi:hypothetical protein